MRGRDVTGLRLVAVALLVGLALSGCASTAMHPGSVNKFDSDSWDALYVAQTLIEDAKGDPTFTAKPEYKAVLNKAIAAYNVAESAWQVWHAAAVEATRQGAPTPPAVTLEAQIASLAAEVANLRAVFKPGKVARVGAEVGAALGGAT